MSIDISFYKDLEQTSYADSGYDTLESSEITSFTLSSRLNDYWGTYNLIKQNYDKILMNDPEIFIYEKGKIRNIYEKAVVEKLGRDIENCLKEVIDSNIDRCYIKVIE